MTKITYTQDNIKKSITTREARANFAAMAQRHGLTNAQFVRKIDAYAAQHGIDTTGHTPSDKYALALRVNAELCSGAIVPASVQICTIATFNDPKCWDALAHIAITTPTDDELIELASLMGITITRLDCIRLRDASRPRW
jgi:hypothetical protein